MSTLQPWACKSQFRDFFGSIVITTKHSLLVPKALLTPTCNARGLRCLPWMLAAIPRASAQKHLRVEMMHKNEKRNIIRYLGGVLGESNKQFGLQG